MSPALAGFCSSMSRTIRPFERSCAATACLSPPSISPFVGAPARSIALNAYVAIGLGHPHRSHQPAQLLRRAGPRLGELPADLVLADELRQRRVHRLHAELR